MIEFNIKICGITTATDAVRAFEFGADAIGLNFYPKSMRSITAEEARTITSAFEPPEQPKWVGVFVNETPENINATAETVGLDYVQLHGDESPEIAKRIKNPIIRAVRVLGVDISPAVNEIQGWVGAGIAAILLDKGSSTQYGGTGKALDWDSASKLESHLPIILAGGLNPSCVAEAISIAKPAAVDVASGVEKFPGAKDEGLMRDFIQAAKRQFDN